MKINAVTNYNAFKPTKKTNNTPAQNFSQPSFKMAKVNVLWDHCDELTNFYVQINEYPMKQIVNKLVPFLEKLDKNLSIAISGTEKSRFFKKNLKGLKFEVGYIDQKKAYVDILNAHPQRIHYKTIEGLREKDEVLLYMLGQPGKIAKLYNTDKESPEQFIDICRRLVDLEVAHLPKKLLGHNALKRLPNGKFELLHEFGRKADWEKYTLYL